MHRTPETEQRLSALWGAVARDWPHPSNAETLAGLRRIGESGEVWAATSLLALALGPEELLASTAAEAIDRLLSPVVPAEWPAVDRALRSAALGWWAVPEMRPPTVAAISRYPLTRPHALSVLACASCACDGYLREAGLLRLSELHDGVELPLLILRANDWVPSVQRRAAQFLRERVVPAYADQWITCLELVQWMRTWMRNDAAREIVAAIDAMLIRDECRPALEHGIRSGNRVIRRESFRLGVTTPAGFAWFGRAALEEADPLVRLRAVRRARELAPTETLCRLLNPVLCDSVSQVRMEALSLLADRCPDAAQRELTAALFAETASVRELAWTRCGETRAEIAELYRETIRRDDSTRLPGAIAGLGELGHADDAEPLLPHTVAGTAKTRKAAVRALARLTGEDYRDLYVELMADPEPGVSREATRVLEACASRLAPERLWRMWVDTPVPHVHRNLLRIWRAQPPWQSGPCLLRALAAADAALLPAAEQAVAGWHYRLERTGYQPTPAQEVALAHAVNDYGHRLSASQRALLDFRLRQGSVQPLGRIQPA